MNWQLFLSTFALIFLAEIPDKTALAILIMSTHMRPIAVFCGVAFAFLIQSVVAVVFGSMLTALPERYVHIGAALMFFAFAVSMWIKKEDDEAEAKATPHDKKHFWKPAWSAFVVIFIAEWGDLTQLATATLVAHHQQPWLIGISATLALWTTTALMVIAGSKLKPYINPKLLRKIAPVLFTAVGLYFLVH